MMVPKEVNVLKVTKLYTYKWLKQRIVYYVYLTPIGFHQRRVEVEMRKRRVMVTLQGPSFAKL